MKYYIVEEKAKYGPYTWDQLIDWVQYIGLYSFGNALTDTRCEYFQGDHEIEKERYCVRYKVVDSDNRTIQTYFLQEAVDNFKYSRNDIRAMFRLGILKNRKRQYRRGKRGGYKVMSISNNVSERRAYQRDKDIEGLTIRVPKVIDAWDDYRRADSYNNRDWKNNRKLKKQWMKNL